MSFNEDERLPPIRTALLANSLPRTTINLGSAPLSAIVAPQIINHENDNRFRREFRPSPFPRSLNGEAFNLAGSWNALTESCAGTKSAPSPTLSSSRSASNLFFLSRSPKAETTLPSSFQELVADMKSHPSFTLLVKKVFELCKGQEVIIPDCASDLSIAEEDTDHISNFALVHGVETACSRSTLLDVFFASALTAIKAIVNESPKLHLHSILHKTIVACAQLENSKRLSGSTDRYLDTQTLNFRQKHHGQVHLSPSRALGPGPRPKLRVQAREFLEEWFQTHYDNPYPTGKEKRELAKMCGIRLNQVNNFFGNKRMRIKRKAMAIQKDSTGSRDSKRQSTNPSSVLAPRAKWRAVVLSQVPNDVGQTRAENGKAEIPYHEIIGEFVDSGQQREQYASSGVQNNRVRRKKFFENTMDN